MALDIYAFYDYPRRGPLFTLGYGEWDALHPVFRELERRAGVSVDLTADAVLTAEHVRLLLRIWDETEREGAVETRVNVGFRVFLESTASGSGALKLVGD